MRMVSTWSASLSWEWSLHGLLPSHENGLYMVSFPLMRIVSHLHRGLVSHKSGLWPPQRGGLSQEWSLVSTEGWPLIRVVSGLHRRGASHKSGLWSPQRGGLSQEWFLVSTEGWPLTKSGLHRRVASGLNGGVTSPDCGLSSRAPVYHSCAEFQQHLKQPPTRNSNVNKHPAQLEWSVAKRVSSR